MVDSDASTASRATISTLPLEIKARICELSALQDERYKERWVPGAPGEKLVEVHKNAWRGRSLAALSETSKEFNELAAKHIFHTLTGTQIDSLEFSLVILAHHISCVRRVVITRPEASVVGQAATHRVFVALPLLPNLSDIQLAYGAAIGALGPLLGHNVPSGSYSMIHNAFRPVAQRLRTVALVGFTSSESVVNFLKMCPILQEVTIVVSAVVDASGSGVALINQHALTLRHLTLRLPSDSPLSLPTGFPAFINLPFLTSLALQNITSHTFEPIIAAIAAATRTEADPAKSTLFDLIVEFKDYGNYITFLRTAS
ncbi:hypothetical protein RQP46_002266 [Phenoliferia psychrophenolica]